MVTEFRSMPVPVLWRDTDDRLEIDARSRNASAGVLPEETLATERVLMDVETLELLAVLDAYARIAPPTFRPCGPEEGGSAYAVRTSGSAGAPVTMVTGDACDVDDWLPGGPDGVVPNRIVSQLVERIR